jgi:hypothetical protein
MSITRRLARIYPLEHERLFPFLNGCMTLEPCRDPAVIVTADGVTSDFISTRGRSPHHVPGMFVACRDLSLTARRYLGTRWFLQS